MYQCSSCLVHRTSSGKLCSSSNSLRPPLAFSTANTFLQGCQPFLSCTSAEAENGLSVPTANFVFFFKFICLFIFGCAGSSLLCEGFLQLRQAGATPHRGARASHRCGLSCCGAQAPNAQAQQPWLTGSAAPRHVGSSQTRARTRVPCIGRQTPNHCATREAPANFF